MASNPNWFLSPRVATYLIWRCKLANHNQQILGLELLGSQLLTKGYNLYQANYCNGAELSEMLLKKCVQWTLNSQMV
jgi:hypothetical protein